MINGKIALHLYAPVLSRSGYGAHSREIINYLLQDDRFMVFLQNVNWGGCGSIHEFDLIDKEQIKKYYQCIHNYEQAQQQNVEYDISIYLTIPNEFNLIKNQVPGNALTILLIISSVLFLLSVPLIVFRTIIRKRDEKKYKEKLNQLQE